MVEMVELGGRAGLEVSAQASRRTCLLTTTLTDTVEPCFSDTDDTPSRSSSSTRQQLRFPWTISYPLPYHHMPLCPRLTSPLFCSSSAADSCSGWPSRVSSKLSSRAISLVDTVSISLVITTIVINARRGLSTVQVERIRRWKLLPLEARSPSPSQTTRPIHDPRIRLWVPLPLEECSEGGVVVHVDPTEPLFDLGARQNWRLLMGEQVWQWFGECSPR